MNMILAVARKELKALFASPLAWVLLAFLELLLAIGFLQNLDRFLEVQGQLAQAPGAPGATESIVTSVYATAAIIMLFAVPLLGMRLVAEERRNGTLAFLVSSPLTMTEIVVGKWLGLFAFLLVAIALATLMPLSLTLGGRIDWGLVAALVMGLTLIAASFSAVSLYVSSLTAHPLVAAVGAFGALLMMVFAGDTLGENLRTRGWEVAASLLQVLMPFRQFETFTRGVLDSYSAACALLLTATFLILTVRRLDAARLRG